VSGGRWPAVGAAVPGLAWAACLGLAAAGVEWRATPEPLTLSEAAALGDDAEVMRLVRQGVDPNAQARIRPDLLRSSEYLMTPLEAAIGAEERSTAVLLLEIGAVIHEGNYPALLCFARVKGDAETIALIESRTPGNATVDCTAVKTPW
jgi:hypothetical protein